MRSDQTATNGVRQPIRSKRPRQQRRFDTTSLRASQHGYRVHRDYAAHFFRWSYVKRWVTPNMDVLDIGCGPDFPLFHVLEAAPDSFPKRYVGVDLNPLPKPPSRRWAEFRGGFEFISRHLELGPFDLIVVFEVLEHMNEADGAALLACALEHLRAGGRLMLSTPVFNGRAARNHIHEYEIAELEAVVRRLGFRVERRFGTFASYSDLKRAVTPEEKRILDRLREYYDNEVAACFLAPFYPDHSRNNLWVLRCASDVSSRLSVSIVSPPANPPEPEPPAALARKVVVTKTSGVRHKTCTGCRQLKPITEQFFHRQAINPTGFDPRCKECRAEHRRQRSTK
jgi:SAM-dependent methyltransferase